ncbi:MAG: DNA recombination protein RmuC [Muribaculaceae bacterium]|nr:DNA recombination protein RmuC [Muribaculaceae bacterium]
MEIVFILLSIFFIIIFVFHLKTEEKLKKQTAELNEKTQQLTGMQIENKVLKEQLDRITSEHEREIKRIHEDRKDTEERMRGIAAEVLQRSAMDLAELSHTRVSEIINPVADNLRQFQNAFKESYDKEARERFSLSEKIKELVELNHCIGIEAKRLTQALQGNNKVQGDWGEMILDNILKRSGLTEGREYFLQFTSENEQGKKIRPDAVLNYPDGRTVIIDSKTSMKAYLQALNASDAAEADKAMKAHAQSVKLHISELKNKSYQDYVGSNSVDFVMMFIPHEGAYLAAMNTDPSLWEYAFDNRIIIVSPTHLMSVVKLIEQMWRHDKQTKNAVEIANQASKMLEKMRGFLEDMDKIDRSLDNARDAWDSAFSKLTGGKGNLISRADSLYKLGVKTSKELPSKYTDKISE